MHAPREMRLIDGIEHWRCSTCGAWKPQAFFYLRPETYTNRCRVGSQCRHCHGQTHRKSKLRRARPLNRKLRDDEMLPREFRRRHAERISQLIAHYAAVIEPAKTSLAAKGLEPAYLGGRPGRPVETADGREPYLWFAQVSLAAEAVGVTKSRITRACNEGFHAAGRTWRYAESAHVEAQP